MLVRGTDLSTKLGDAHCLDHLIRGADARRQVRHRPISCPENGLWKPQTHMATRLAAKLREVRFPDAASEHGRSDPQPHTHCTIQIHGSNAGAAVSFVLTSQSFWASASSIQAGFGATGAMRIKNWPLMSFAVAMFAEVHA